MLSLDYTVCSSHCSQGKPENIHGAEAAPIPASSSGLWSSVDRSIWAHGILCLPSLGYWDVIFESERGCIDQGTTPVAISERATS